MTRKSKTMPKSLQKFHEFQYDMNIDDSQSVWRFQIFPILKQKTKKQWIEYSIYIILSSSRDESWVVLLMETRESWFEKFGIFRLTAFQVQTASSDIESSMSQMQHLYENMTRFSRIKWENLIKFEFAIKPSMHAMQIFWSRFYFLCNLELFVKAQKCHFDSNEEHLNLQTKIEWRL